MRAALRHFHWFRQWHFLALRENRAAFGRQFKHVELIRILFHETETNQLPANRAPFGTSKLFPDAVSGKLLMVPLAHVFRVRAEQHVHNLIQAKPDAALLARAHDAGKKFLPSEVS